MFLIVIDELVDILASFCIIVKVFADDVKLYIRILNDVDVTTLQEALQCDSCLCRWTNVLYCFIISRTCCSIFSWWN